MPAKDVVIRISAIDAASPTFRKIAADAKAMGAQVETVATTSDRSFQKFNRGAFAMGAAIGSATLLLGEFSRAAAEDEANQERLQQAVENTGKSYDIYADAIAKAIKRGQDKAFSDDATRKALVTLNMVTNDTGKSLDQLGLAMDFARAKGIDLSTSASIIAKVYGGNLGILSRYGIVLEEGATATEALAQLQERSAGQAETYANTQLGQVDRMKDKFEELTESIGASTGSLQTFLLLLPGLSAGATAITGMVAGMGGVGALSAGLLKYGGPAALIAGGASLAYGYSQDSIGTTQTNEFWNNFFKTGSNVMNTILPGSPYDVNKYNDQMAANEIGDALMAIFGGPGGSDAAVNRANIALDNPAFRAGTNEVFNYDEDDLKKYVGEAAALAGVTVGEYLLTAAKSSTLVLDTVTGTYKTPAELANATQFRTQSTASYMGSPGDSGLSSALAPPQSWQDFAQQNPAFANADQNQRTTTLAGGIGVAELEAQQEAIGQVGMELEKSLGAAVQYTNSWSQAQNEADRQLKILLGGMYEFATGTETAGAALDAFKSVQDGLLESQGVYSQQISEFSSQVNAQDAAYEILNQRRTDGIALTEEETSFLDGYASANERGTGAVEDAIIAQGMLAQTYLENMTKGDQLNDTLSENAGAMGDLVTVIEDLILSMDGVPEEVRTRIELDRAQEAIDSLASVTAWLNGLDGRTATFYVNASGNGLSLGNPSGVGITDGFQDGGTMNHYAGGATHYGGGWSMVGERGPEAVWMPNGSQVMNTEGSKARFGDGGGGININGPITIVANTPQQLWRQIREQSVGSARQ